MSHSLPVSHVQSYTAPKRSLKSSNQLRLMSYHPSRPSISYMNYKERPKEVHDNSGKITHTTKHPRTTLHQHHTHPGNGRRAKSQLRSSRHPYGSRPAHLPALDPHHAL